MILTSIHMMALATLPQQGRHSRPGKGVFICLKAKDS
jgi:hypothetical protein